MDVLRTRSTLLNNQIEKMKEMVSGKQFKPVELTMQQEKYNLAKEEHEQARNFYKDPAARAARLPQNATLTSDASRSYQINLNPASS